jgi:hypothetical protein
MSGPAILKTPPKPTERDNKDAREHNRDDHRNHPGNIFSGSSDHEPRRWQGENDGDHVDVSRSVLNRLHVLTI